MFLCQFFLSSYDEDGNELPELEVEDPYKNDYQQVKDSLPYLPSYKTHSKMV